MSIQVGAPAVNRLRSRKPQSRFAIVSLRLRLLTGAVLLVAWEVSANLFAPTHVARPSNVVKVLPAVFSDSQFWASAGSTIVAVLEGLLIGVVLGVIVGLAMGRLRVLEHALKFYVQALFTLPIVALLPLIIMWFGYSSATRLFIVVIGSFLPVAMNAFDGSRFIPREYLEVALSYRAQWWRVWFGVALPSSLPYLLSGIRLAAGRALVGAVVAEFMVGIDGLGYYILSNSQSFKQNEAMVAVLLLTLIGVVLNFGTDAAVRRFLSWYRRGL
jgi:ABC-type nitrate/sulfonate/bicarbonate transport system permease component